MFSLWERRAVPLEQESIWTYTFDLEAAHTTGEQVKCKNCTRFALSQLYRHAVINEFRDVE